MSGPSELPWGEIWPPLKEFRELAKDRRVIPVVRKVLADEATPLGIYRALARNKPGTFIMESADAAGAWSRWSFIGARSRAQLLGDDAGQAHWVGDVPVGILRSGPTLEVLQSALSALDYQRVDNSAALGTPAGLAAGKKAGECAENTAALGTPDLILGLPPFTGGLAGTLGWSFVNRLEPTLPHTAPDELGAPEVALALATDVVALDHHTGTVWLIANAINMDNTDQRVDEAHADALQRLDELAARLIVAPPARPQVLDIAQPLPELEFRTSREVFEAAVAQGKWHVYEGDVFQVVLSQRIDLDCPADPLEVYRALRTINPSPYMYYFRLADSSGEPFAVVGSSPETLVKVEAGEVVTFPIAGSRPRGATVEEDLALAEELLADPKERSEHVMLVDLSRNDLSRVSRPGTVEVAEFMALRRFSHVMHITSTVVGQLRPGKTALDALAATFPAGTLSGAPKPRAIAIIDDLEPAARGIYGGTVGYFDFAGNLDMAIAIRTAFIRNGRASVQAGAGIVADSVPEAEYLEARNKAAAAVRAVQIAAQLRPLSDASLAACAACDAVGDLAPSGLCVDCHFAVVELWKTGQWRDEE